MSVASQAYTYVKIETPENIRLDYELAGPGTRMAAFIIDFAIIIVVMSLLSYVVVSATSSLTFMYPRMANLILAVWFIFILVMYFLGGFLILQELFMQGQTVGKKIMGIRVINATGTPAVFVQLLIRNLFRLIDCNFPFQHAIGGMCLIFSKNTQRPGDMVAGTLVVKERKTEKAASFQYRKQTLAELQGGNIKLRKEEFDLIMEYLRIHSTLSSPRRNELSEKLVYLLRTRHKLDAHADFIPLLAEFGSSPPGFGYIGAEKVLARMLSYYAEGGN